MGPGPVLELRTGAPRWYPAAGMAGLNVVVLSLCLTPLEWPFALAVLGLSCLILIRSAWQLIVGNRYPIMRVYSDYALTLTTLDDSEFGVRAAGSVWISQWLVVLKIELPEERSLRVVISRDRNDTQAFRRLSVLSRFQFAVADRERQNGRQVYTQGA